jgi:hypothetical protein
VLSRNDQGLWLPVDVPQWADWHAVRVDARGDVWVVGGSLLSAARMDEGAVLRFGPPREARSQPVLPDAGALDGAMTADGGLPELPLADDDIHIADADAGPTIPDVPDVPTVSDTQEIPDTSDTSDIATPPTDGTSTTDASDVVPSTPFSPGLGLAAYGSNPQLPTRLADGDTALMIHGPQGGFHLELVVHVSALDIDPATERHDLETRLSLNVAGVDVAGFGPASFPFWSNGDGTWETTVFPLVFQHGVDFGEPRAGDFDGREGLLSVSVVVGTTTRAGSVWVRLVDTW